MDYDELKNKGFGKFCIENNISTPHVFLNRKKSDALTQSIKCHATIDADYQGMPLFRVHHYSGLHIVDKREFDFKLKKFEKYFSDKKNCSILEKNVILANNNTKQITDFLRKGLPIREALEMYFCARIDRARIRYVFEIYKKYTQERFFEIQSIIQENYRGNNSERYYLSHLFSSAFTPKNETLEIFRYNLYCDLIDCLIQNPSLLDKKLDYFYEQFGNLNYVRMGDSIQTKDDLFKYIQTESEKDWLIYPSKKLQDLKESLKSTAIYTLFPKYLSDAEEFCNLVDRLDFIVHEESWSRQVWTRLNIAARPYFLELESFLSEKGFILEDKRIFDYELEEVRKLLEGYHENKKICTCNI